MLVLGGCGIQGKGVLFDLSKNPHGDRILCADLDPGLSGGISQHQFLSRMLAPGLQYQDDEKDLAVMQNVSTGKRKNAYLQCTD